MKKHVFYSELAYVIGIVILTLGTSLMEAANLGMSMVVAPAYLIHLKVSQYLPFFSFGMSEYVFQGFLIIMVALIMRRFKLAYLFSFVTAVFYGLVLDVMVKLTSFIPTDGMVIRIVIFLVGLLFCAAGVSFLFHTYISPEAYELFVAEVSKKTGININKFKTGYDISSFVVGVILSFIFFGFGKFEGIGFGTLFCALVNGTCIGIFSKIYEHIFEFRDGLPLRGLFTGKKD